VKRKRYPRKFQRIAVERTRNCDDVGELAQELGVTRRSLYKWRVKLDVLEAGEEAARASTHEGSYSKQVQQLKRPQAGLVRHSDRGLQYASPEYVAALDKYGLVASMNRPANPYDNASCESFMKTLKQEEIYASHYDNLEQLRANIEEFIEEYYNRQRLHSALGYRPPEEFEQQSERGQPAGSLGATVQFIVNDGNGENEERASTGLSGEGDSNAAPFPRPQPLLGDAKTLK